MDMLRVDSSVCSICGQPLTAFGSKELKNGCLCRDCAKKVSSWLEDEDLKKKSVNTLKRHLKYREDNLNDLNDFNPTIVVSGKYTLYIDESHGLFTFSKKSDLLKDNADLLPLDDVRSIAISKVKYQDSDSVDVYFEVKLKNVEVKKIRFRVNEFPGLVMNSVEYVSAAKLANDYLNAFSKLLELNTMVMKRR